MAKNSGAFLPRAVAPGSPGGIQAGLFESPVLAPLQGA